MHSEVGHRTPAFTLRIATKLWTNFVYPDLQSILSMEKGELYPGVRLRYTEWEQQEDLEVIAPLALSVARVLEVCQSSDAILAASVSLTAARVLSQTGDNPPSPPFIITSRYIEPFNNPPSPLH